jgi:hypothetical protein
VSPKRPIDIPPTPAELAEMQGAADAQARAEPFERTLRNIEALRQAYEGEQPVEASEPSKPHLRLVHSDNSKPNVIRREDGSVLTFETGEPILMESDNEPGDDAA